MAAIAVLCLVVGVGCGSDEEAPEESTSDSILFDAPTKEELGEIAGIVVPEESSEFRAVAISESEINIRFLIPTATLETFLSESEVDVALDSRVINHSSPVWELNEEGSYSGGSASFGTLDRTVEIVDDGSDFLIVRLVIKRPEESGS